MSLTPALSKPHEKRRESTLTAAGFLGMAHYARDLPNCKLILLTAPFVLRNQQGLPKVGVRYYFTERIALFPDE